MLDYFPLDIAQEDAFFDRVNERKRLIYNLQSNTHTVVSSPRRHGKTSVVLKSIEEAGLLGVSIDMMVATDAEKNKHLVLEGIGRYYKPCFQINHVHFIICVIISC